MSLAWSQPRQGWDLGPRSMDLLCYLLILSLGQGRCCPTILPMVPQRHH